MSFTFDGPNKKIRISSGITSITTVDIYSRWVDWLLTSDNSKYLPAFRTVGGDPISPTKSLGFTLFLLNDWRIVPQSLDHTLIIDGNLYTDPYGGIRVDNVPGYTIMVEYTVSNLTDSSISVLEIANLQRLIEGLRPNHSGFGNMWYWDPYGGNDKYSGTHPSTAFRTFAKAHDAAADWNHDIIIAHPGNPYTTTTTTENLVISKNYLFLRGPGRDFIIQPANNSLDCISITGTGVEVSKVNIANVLNNTQCAIHTTGDYTLLKSVILNYCNNGIHIHGSNRGMVENVEVEYCGGYGIKVSGGAREITLRDSVVSDNAGSGIIIDNTTGDDINIRGDSSIYSNGGYGIDITTGTSGVSIHDNVEVTTNNLGNIHDFGTGTSIETSGSAPSSAENANAVWDSLLSRTNVSGSFGEFVSKKILTIAKYIGLK